jgi:peptide deformylase
MAVLPIIADPSPVLRAKAAPVTSFDAALAILIDDLFETLDAAGGIGLAAPQVGCSRRVLVMHVPDGNHGRLALINPRLERTAMPAIIEESCLSLPGLTGLVRRALRVEVSGCTPCGTPQTWQLSDMEAVCAQHEMDHLDGILFADRLSLWQRLRRRFAR